MLSSRSVGATKTTNNLQTEAAKELWFAPLMKSPRRIGIRTRSPAGLLHGKVLLQISIQISIGLQKATTLPPEVHPNIITRFSAYHSRERTIDTTKLRYLAAFLLLLSRLIKPKV